MVTPKHFAVHGAVMGGRDSHDMGLSERQIREIHLVPFRHAIGRLYRQRLRRTLPRQSTRHDQRLLRHQKQDRN
ncbi:hypothetical protein ACQ86N_21955 [Puia sp. P3]|uniref:hypothetical protein n=1 Tax=Puia sp. P3 TaxID=3423952 RepID=UPI003D673301